MVRFTLLLIMFIMVACQDGSITGGRITAKKDLESWRSNAIAVFEPAFGDSLFSIVGKAFNNQEKLVEEISFSKIPPRVGTYQVSIGDAPHIYKGIGIFYAKLEAGGHVISEVYELDTLYQNFFSVDAFDESLRRINATFECRMMHVSGLKDTTYTIFKEGSIEVSIEDY